MCDLCSAPSLQSLCIYSLANTEAGQAVVNIMGVGVDTINMVLAAQPSRYTLIELGMHRNAQIRGRNRKFWMHLAGNGNQK